MGVVFIVLVFEPIKLHSPSVLYTFSTFLILPFDFNNIALVSALETLICSVTIQHVLFRQTFSKSDLQFLSCDSTQIKGNKSCDSTQIKR